MKRLLSVLLFISSSVIINNAMADAENYASSTNVYNMMNGFLPSGNYSGYVVDARTATHVSGAGTVNGDDVSINLEKIPTFCNVNGKLTGTVPLMMSDNCLGNAKITLEKTCASYPKTISVKVSGCRWEDNTLTGRYSVLVFSNDFSFSKIN